MYTDKEIVKRKAMKLIVRPVLCVSAAAFHVSVTVHMLASKAWSNPGWVHLCGKEDPGRFCWSQPPQAMPAGGLSTNAEAWLHHQSSWTLSLWFPWRPDELWSACGWIRVTRWCRCRQRWWPASWEWSQWCPAWPGCSPPCFPCLGFPFPHHCGECWPFSQ